MKLSSLTVYLVGVVVLVAGIGYAAHLAHVPDRWIAAVAVVLLGAGIISAVARTRHRDPPVAP